MSIEEFTILSKVPGDEEPTEVETGLSPGELRQALLDYLGEELDNGQLVAVNACLENYDLSLSQHVVRTKKGYEQAMHDLEDLLYSLEDEDLDNSEWPLSDETLCVEGVRE